MPASGTLDGTEKLPLVKGGSNVAGSVDDVKNYITSAGLDYLTSPEIVLTDDPQQVLSVTLNPNTVYTVECLLLLENGNTDGFGFIFNSSALNITTFAAVYTTSTGVTGVMNEVMPTILSDITGETFIHLRGLVSIGLTGGLFGVDVRKSTNVTTDPTVATGSFIRVS